MDNQRDVDGHREPDTPYRTSILLNSSIAILPCETNEQTEVHGNALADDQYGQRVQIHFVNAPIHHQANDDSLRRLIVAVKASSRLPPQPARVDHLDQQGARPILGIAET